MASSYAEAEDALVRFLRINAAAVQGYVLLWQVRKRRGDQSGAAKALAEARSTYRQLPAFRQRKDLLWYLRTGVA